MRRPSAKNCSVSFPVRAVSKGQGPRLSILTLRGQIKTVISELKTMMDAFSVQLAQLNTQVGDLQASIVEKDQQIAELSQRPTVEELQDARTGSLVLSADQETNLVTLEFDDPGKRQPPGLGQSARESDYHSPSGRGQEVRSDRAEEVRRS